MFESYVFVKGNVFFEDLKIMYLLKLNEKKNIWIKCIFIGIPKDGRLDELYRPLADWNNVPDTKWEEF